MNSFDHDLSTGRYGWSELILSYLEVWTVLLDLFISEVLFRPLHSALNYFREFK